MAQATTSLGLVYQISITLKLTFTIYYQIASFWIKVCQIEKAERLCNVR
jgi:hypothetical protein